ncbi:MAG: hypothetical protein AB7G75_11020 [Candidatus Binatia bacterium]
MRQRYVVCGAASLGLMMLLSPPHVAGQQGLDPAVLTRISQAIAAASLLNGHASPESAARDASPVTVESGATDEEQLASDDGLAALDSRQDRSRAKLDRIRARSVAQQQRIQAQQARMQARITAQQQRMQAQQSRMQARVMAQQQRMQAQQARMQARIMARQQRMQANMTRMDLQQRHALNRQTARNRLATIEAWRPAQIDEYAKLGQHAGDLTNATISLSTVVPGPHKPLAEMYSTARELRSVRRDISQRRVSLSTAVDLSKTTMRGLKTQNRIPELKSAGRVGSRLLKVDSAQKFYIAVQDIRRDVEAIRQPAPVKRSFSIKTRTPYSRTSGEQNISYYQFPRGGSVMRTKTSTRQHFAR